MAEYYSKNLAREVQKGMTENALKGLRTGGTAALGFNVDPNTRKYTINEREAEAARMIFKMYIEGSGYGVIADALNAQGYKTKTGRSFRIVRAACGFVLPDNSTIGISIGKISRFHRWKLRMYL